MLYVFKKFTVKNWIAIAAIFLLTFAQVYFTMSIILAVGELTATVTSGTVDLIWRQGFFMIICALLLCACQIVIQFIASHTASSIATNLRQGKKQNGKIKGINIIKYKNGKTSKIFKR